MITAVVLTAGEYERRFDGIEVLVQRQAIRTPGELLAARFQAILAVRTEHFFFLDDDDDLPDDYLDVLQACVNARCAIAYTDELVRLPDGTESVRKSASYSQTAHLTDPLLAHHLVLCDTDQARRAAVELPRGHYCPEFMLYWALAKQDAAYIPRVGYVWNKGEHGMHTWPTTTISQMRALLWCRKNP